MGLYFERFRAEKDKRLFRLTLGAVLLIPALIGCFLNTEDPTPWWPKCSFQQTFGLPCATCGMTRSFVALSHGELMMAWDFNFPGFVLYFILFVSGITLLFEAFTGRGLLPRAFLRRRWGWLILLYVIICVVSWAVVLCRVPAVITFG